MIYVTGDTHGSYRHVRAFAREHSLGPDDVIVWGTPVSTTSATSATTP